MQLRCHLPNEYEIMTANRSTDDDLRKPQFGSLVEATATKMLDAVCWTELYKTASSGLSAINELLVLLAIRSVMRGILSLLFVCVCNSVCLRSPPKCVTQCPGQTSVPAQHFSQIRSAVSKEIIIIIIIIKNVKIRVTLSWITLQGHFTELLK